MLYTLLNISMSIIFYESPLCVYALVVNDVAGRLFPFVVDVTSNTHLYDKHFIPMFANLIEIHIACLCLIHPIISLVRTVINVAENVFPYLFKT